MPQSAIAAFDEVVARVVARPGLYVGRCSLRAVSTYLDGYTHAMHEHGLGEPLAGWGLWVYRRFMIWHPAWHWTRILLHEYGTDREALAALPSLYKEFTAERDAMNLDDLLVDLRQRLFAKHGQDWYEPETTHTTTFGESP